MLLSASDHWDSARRASCVRIVNRVFSQCKPAAVERSAGASQEGSCVMDDNGDDDEEEETAVVVAPAIVGAKW